MVLDVADAAQLCTSIASHQSMNRFCTKKSNIYTNLPDSIKRKSTRVPIGGDKFNYNSTNKILEDFIIVLMLVEF